MITKSFFFILQKVTDKDDSTEFNGPLNKFRITLTVFSTSYNSVLYLMYNESFRTGFKNLLTCRCLQMLRHHSNIGSVSQGGRPDIPTVSARTPPAAQQGLASVT